MRLRDPRRTIENGAVYNVIVLIFSLIGTVVVVFSDIMRKLEKWCQISTAEPNKHVGGGGGSVSSAPSLGSTADGEANANDGFADKSAGARTSMQYADFDNDASASAARDDRRGGDGSDDVSGDAVEPLPFRGNVVIQANECAVEMQSIQRLPPTISQPPAAVLPVPVLPRHALEMGGDRDSQLMAMLADIRREMREQAERSEMQFAFLSAQMAHSEGEITALKSDLGHIESRLCAHDQKNQQLEHWMRESHQNAH